LIASRWGEKGKKGELKFKEGGIVAGGKGEKEGFHLPEEEGHSLEGERNQAYCADCWKKKGVASLSMREKKRGGAVQEGSTSELP